MQFWRRLGRIFWLTYTLGVSLFYLRQWWETVQGRRIARQHALIPPIALQTLPHVTVVVPARNEERNIRRCVASLLAQQYPYFTIIVVNDHSTDRTAAILADMQQRFPVRLQIIDGETLPEGWAGKPHAMAQGADKAEGEYILFTDADTIHLPDALHWAVARAMVSQADLFSALTRQEIVDISNHLILPVIVMGITALYPPTMVANPNNSLAIANGQFLLIRRAVYEAVGGYRHPDLRGSVVDDRDMAALVKRSGYRVVLTDGAEHVRVCMYRTLPEAWRGWSKNAYVGSRGGPLVFLMLVSLLPLGTIMPFVFWLIGLFARRRWLLVGSTIQIGTLLFYRWWLDREIGHSRWWGLTHPAGSAIVTALTWHAGWRQLRGRGVEWNGRVYQAYQREPRAVHNQSALEQVIRDPQGR